LKDGSEEARRWRIAFKSPFLMKWTTPSEIDEAFPGIDDPAFRRQLRRISERSAGVQGFESSSA
jgi:hypothetical protein